MYIIKKCFLININITIILLQLIIQNSYKVINSNTSNNLNLSSLNQTFIFKQPKEEYLLKIFIPKINLTKKIYNLNDPKNNVDKNVEILNFSNLSRNYLVLAAHSGNNKNAYFNNIHLLKENDKIHIDINNKKITYSVKNMYYITKTGYIELKEYDQDKIILITCSVNHKNKQLVVIGNLQNINSNNVK